MGEALKLKALMDVPVLRSFRGSSEGLAQLGNQSMGVQTPKELGNS
jgi:hypothetical protein